MRKFEVCPGTLSKGFDKYSPVCIRKMFDSKQVSPILDFDYDSTDKEFITSINRIYISGVQEKLSVVLSEDKKLKLTPIGEHGGYIIKPAPAYKYLRYREYLPANEHLTMQIARQVYGIKTAENAMTFFANGEAAYITKRFDYTPEGLKIRQEDFSSLAGKSEKNHGKNFKYSGSYEEAAELIRSNVAAWQVEMSRFFALVVFNYLFCNGDAHLKNFSLQQTVNGDYILSPAYDLINTSIHVDDEDFALQEGLMSSEFHSETYNDSGHACQEDFEEFGRRIGVAQKKMETAIKLFATEQPMVYELTERSFLDERTKRIYKRLYQERLHCFQRGER